MLMLNRYIHSHPTRFTNNLHLCNPKTFLAHRSFRHTGPDMELATRCSQVTHFPQTRQPQKVPPYKQYDDSWRKLNELQNFN